MNATSILVVEDEALIADDLERTLKRLGYLVPAVVADGERAIEAAAVHAPSLVLMDIKLRGRVDGIEAARAIRERSESPVVFLTSYSDTATLSRASAARPYGYVLKPFAERDLRVAIELALHKHEVEHTLRARERWFATTLRSVGDGVVATDDKLAVTFMNRVAEELTGWACADALGRAVDEVLRLRVPGGGPVEGPAAVALRSGCVAHLPVGVELVHRDGAAVPVDDSAAPIVDASGAVLGAVVVLRDVSARKDLELRVARSERLASLGTMAAGICHEINNPLSCVVAGVGYSLEALDEEALRGEVRDSLRDAQEAATRIAEIVREFRAFARPLDERRVQTDLREVLEAALKLTAHVLRQHVRVERSYEAAPLVLADPSNLSQVFVNLLLNAAQATPPGAADRHAVHVSLRADAAGRALVEVRDEGVGIAPAALRRVFDPFFTTKAPGEGMGLGLSISSRIVEAHGGAIDVESAPGAGTVFRVSLPPAEGLRRGEPKAERASVPPKRRRRVLIIDDEETVARTIARVLQTQHDVETCADGRAALVRLLGRDTYDAVLCDLMMPAMGGSEVYDAVLAARPAQAARFAFLTGGVTTEAAAAFLERAGRPIFLKPLSGIAELRDAVNALITSADGD
jgi:two-component system cell cycle sensor histidine kinase/response regulator CckA